jgi:hypothetical protein
MEHSPSSRRCGVLVARAWQEPGAGTGLRVRVFWTAETLGGAAATPDSLVVDTRDEFMAVVAEWLTRMTRQHSSDE